MNKKILCLVIAILMLLPFILTSCKKELTEQEIMDNISNSGATALTLSIWVPTDSDVNDQEFKDRLSAVEDEINVILRDKNYSTKIDLVAISNDDYETQLSHRFDTIKENIANGDKLPYLIADAYVNTTNKTPIGNSYIYELNYPSVLSNQIDIFYIRDYDDYRSYVAADHVQKLDSYLDKVGGRYKDLAKKIKPEFLSAMNINGSTYAIPNNHQYGDQYQFILIDKEIFDSQDTIKIETITDIYSCKAFIDLVGQGGQSGVVPFVGTLNDAPGIVDFDSSNLVGSTITDGAPSSVFDIEEYNKYVAMYKELQGNSYVKDTLSDDEKAAVSFLYGTNTDAQALSENYYIIKSEMPIAREDTLFESGFAISKYSANYDRAMKVLYLLETDAEIITLLQYGIEGEDYKIEFDDKTSEESFVISKDTKYDMSSIYFGNGYMTYKENNSNVDVDGWADIKDINYDTIVTPYLGFLYNYTQNATEEEKEQLATLKNAVATLTSEVYAEIIAMSAEEYAEFLELYNVDIDDVNKQIEKLAENEDASEPSEEYAELLALKAKYEANETVVKLKSSEDYAKLIELYESLTKKYN